MGFLKKIKKGAKRTGRAIKSGAKATKKAAVKSGKKVAEVSKDTYKTTKHLGGKFAGSISTGSSFWNVIANIFLLPATYIAAVGLGLLLAVIFGTNTVELSTAYDVFGCEYLTSPADTLQCKCSYAVCRDAYPSECSGVDWQDNSCLQSMAPAGNASQNDTINPDCRPPVSSSVVQVGRTGLEDGKAFITLIAPDFLLPDYYGEYDAGRILVGDQEFSDCRDVGDGYRCYGFALPSTASSKNIAVTVLGTNRGTACQNIQTGEVATGAQCDVQNAISQISTMLGGPRLIRLIPSVLDCPIYSTTIKSSQITLASVQPISGKFWADATSLFEGECTTLHWSYQGSVAEAELGVSLDLLEYTHLDATQMDSYRTCPVQDTSEFLVIRDQNGAFKRFRIDITVLPRPVDVAPAAEANRCEAFSGMNMSVVYLDWIAGSPLTFYVRMPGGVPGLENEIAGEGDDWNYSAAIGGYNTDTCFTYPNDPNARERLYCSITLPSAYANSFREMELHVNGCDIPIYTNASVGVPGYAAGSANNDQGNETGSSCGAAPSDTESSDYQVWCSCMGGSVQTKSEYFPCSGSSEGCYSIVTYCAIP